MEERKEKIMKSGGGGGGEKETYFKDALNNVFLCVLHSAYHSTSATWPISLLL